MPLSPTITFSGPDGKTLPGPVEITDPECSSLTGCYGEEFEHCVYTIQKDYFYALLYGVDFIRKHEPLTIVKQLDKMSVPLMKYLVNGTFLQKVEIRWFQYNEKKGKTEEYFRMTLEHVRLHSIKYLLPDVKNTNFERYGHLEEIQLMYQKITWLYTKGTILYTDIWNDAFGEFDQKDFSENTDAIAGLTEMPLIEPLKLKFSTGIFEEPKDGFQFDKKATVKFTFESNRKPDYKENKVYAKLFVVYSGKTEDMYLINEGRLVNDDSWSTEFKLKKPVIFEKDANRSPAATVEYYVVIENTFAINNNFKSGSITLPSEKTEELKGAINIQCALSATREIIANAELTLQDDKNEFTGTTDENGYISWIALPVGIYSVVATIGGKTYSSPAKWYKDTSIIHTIKLKTSET